MANCPMPAGTVGSRRTAARRTPGTISFSNSSHFPLRLYSNSHEAGGVAARSNQALHEARSHADRGRMQIRSEWSLSPGSTRNVAVPPLAARMSGASSTRSRPSLADGIWIAAALTNVDLNILSIDPAERRQGIQEHAQAGL